MNCQITSKITQHINAGNQTCAKEFAPAAQTKGIKHMSKHFMPKNLERCSLSVARCELNNLTDCTSKGLAIGVSHLGGEARYSVVTIHKVALDNSYGVVVMNMRINWDDKQAIPLFKQAILAARKVICEHNKLLKLSTHPLKVSTSHQPAALSA